MVLSFWETIERCMSAPRMDERAFNMKIWRTVSELAREYELVYDPEVIIPRDKQLADDVFEAGLKAAISLGVYSRDTQRNVRFTETEIREFLNAATGSQSGYGTGKDEAQVTHRLPGSSVEPIVYGAPQTAIYSNAEVAYKMYKLCAREPSTDGIWGGLVVGPPPPIEEQYDVRANHPSEIFQYRHQYRQEVALMRWAIADVGRPGMFIKQNAPTAQATIALADREVGVRPTDPLGGNLFEELKIDWNFANRTAFAIAYETTVRLLCDGVQDTLLSAGFPVDRQRPPSSLWPVHYSVCFSAVQIINTLNSMESAPKSEKHIIVLRVDQLDRVSMLDLWHVRLWFGILEYLSVLKAVIILSQEQEPLNSIMSVRLVKSRASQVVRLRTLLEERDNSCVQCGWERC
jgi:hypothetical protein